MITPPAVKIKIPETEVLAERQLLEDERAYLACARDVAYRPEDEVIVLQMQSGVAVEIPLRLIDELADAPLKALERDLKLAVGGDAISVRSLDVDIAISGLLRDIFGLNFQRLGGRAKTEAKAAAARANGSKGGRPRKPADKAPAHGEHRVATSIIVQRREGRPIAPPPLVPSHLDEL